MDINIATSTGEDHGNRLSSTLPETEMVKIQPGRGFSIRHLRDLWEYRELLYFFVWRDIKVRYKQTLLGVLWILIQPVVSTLVFSALFGRFLGISSNDIPYPLFTYVALLPWNYFATALSRAATSLVGSAHLITKVYFPRLIIPLSSTLAGLVDFAVAFLVLIGLMIYYDVPPTWSLLLLPALTLLTMLTALGFGLWFSALNVRYRDINYVIPFLVQIWMYVTPVFYGPTLIPTRYRSLLGLNPMTGVVEGFRWALLGETLWNLALPPWTLLVSLGGVLVVLISGLLFFYRTERAFADIV